MSDLPIATTPPVPAAGDKPPAGSALRSYAARAAVPAPATSPFQDALALELGLVPDGFELPGPALPAVAAPRRGSDEPAEDAVAAGDAGAAPAGMAFSVMGALPPQLTPRAMPATPAAARSSLALAGAGNDAAALTWEARMGPGAQAAAASASAQQSPPEVPAAAVAATGGFAPSAHSEDRRESAFASGLADLHPGAAAHAPAAMLAHRASADAAEQLASAGVATLDARVDTRDWGQGLGERLVWMAHQKQQTAELHLNPPDLGPLKITLTLNDDQASAQFVCAHATVREAIETAMPRLREMLADSGIALGNASVSSETFPEQAPPRQDTRAVPATTAASASADAGAAERGAQLLRRAHGLVDTFA